MVPGPLLLACIDFVEPNIPDAGGPAILSATAVISDRGTVDVGAMLDPGLDHLGVRRQVPEAGLEAYNATIEPDRVQRDGRRFYEAGFEFDPAVDIQTVVFLAPVVPGIAAPRPGAHLFGIRRLGPDTLRLVSGADLLLAVTAEPGTTTPAPDIRQWFLNLGSATDEVRLGGNGPPPDTMIIPTRFIPMGDSLEVRLIYQQSVDVRGAPGDYIGLFVLDSRVFWTVRVEAGAPPGESEP